MKSIFILLSGLLLASLLFGQPIPFDPEAPTSVQVITIEEPLTLDGELSEVFWGEVTPASNFRQFFPTDSVYAKGQTEIYLAADKENLYVGVKCYSSGNKWIVPSLKRDYRAGGNDNITLVFDTFDDGTNAIFFGINPEGVIREGLISGGGNRRQDFSESWDNKWKGAAKKYDGYYTGELQIPFSTLRYDASNKKWGFTSYRFDTQTNEMSTWPGTPQNQVLFNLASAGEMNWEEALPEGKKQVSLIPYISAGVNKDFEDGTPADKNFAIGGDAKIAVSAGLNLDLTINPDFSQVEVDQQITNLDRFEIFFPERRQFFLENADLFGQFGFSTINPFFSRRIGVGKDSSTDVTVQNRILGGLRLSGKLNNNTRIGLLNMQTAKSQDQGLSATNYSVLALQQKVLARSNVSFVVVNKQVSGETALLESLGTNRYNRIVGADFNFADASNTWTGKTFIHSSFTEGISGVKFAHGAQVGINKREGRLGWQHEWVQDDYNAETGFIRRTDYFRSNLNASLSFYPGKKVNTYNVGGVAEFITRPGLGKTDHQISLGTEMGFSNNSRLGFFVNNEYVYLTDSFDPTGTDSEELAADTEYNFWNLRAFIRSDFRKKLAFSLNPFVGQYFNGKRYGTRGSITYRYEPRGSVRLDYSVNWFDMPHIEEVKSTFLIGPRIDYTFSKALFTTVFVQYNTQAQNTNINARLQWRFAPVSDFFLVFTDNYFTGRLGTPEDRFRLDVRNRSIVAKLTYWFNA